MNSGLFSNLIDIDLLRNLSNYGSFKTQVNNMIVQLNQAISYLEASKKKSSNCLMINDVSADNNNVAEIYNSLVSQRDFLKNTCIPSIDQEMKGLKQTVEDA